MNPPSLQAATARGFPLASARRILLSLLLFFTLSLLGIFAVHSQLAGVAPRFDARLLRAPAVAAIGLLLLLYYLSDGLRLYYALCALGERIRLSDIGRLVFINLFVSNVTPLATGGGVAQVWFLHRQGISLGTAAAATTIRTALAASFIFVLTPVSLLALDLLAEYPLLRGLRGILAAMVLLYLGFFALVILRPRWLVGLLSAGLRGLRATPLLGDRRHRRWQYRLRRELLRFSTAFGRYLRGRPAHIALSVFWTAAFLLCLFSFPAVLLHVLEHDVDYLEILGRMVVTTFAMYFAPTPGAAGISEGVFASLFGDLVAPTHLLLVVVVWRGLTIYLGMAIGLLLLQRAVLRPGSRG